MLRFGFRVAFAFFTLDTLPRFVWELPGGESLSRVGDGIWRALVPWMGAHVLRLSKPITAPGGPDTAYGYVLKLSWLAIALLVGVVWTLVDSRREYRTLHYWLRVLLRYEVASSVLSYGTAKVFQMQFPAPDLATLMAPVGMQSPHTLLWNFMGFSRTYQIFAGWVECAGALLLFFRRTTTIGAFLIVGAMANVAVMDLSYRTFVMMIAVHLMLGAAFLTIPDLMRLTKVLLLRRPVTDVSDNGPRFRGWKKWVVAAVQAAAIVYLTAAPALEAYRTSKNLARSKAALPLFGLYRVEKFLRNGHEVSEEDQQRWQLIAIDGASKAYSWVQIRHKDESWEFRVTEFDPVMPEVKFASNKSTLEYTRTQDEVVLRGPLDGDPVEITIRRIPPPSFPLNDPNALRWVARW